MPKSKRNYSNKVRRSLDDLNGVIKSATEESPIDEPSNTELSNFTIEETLSEEVSKPNTEQVLPKFEMSITKPESDDIDKVIANSTSIKDINNKITQLAQLIEVMHKQNQQVMQQNQQLSQAVQQIFSVGEDKKVEVTQPQTVGAESQKMSGLMQGLTNVKDILTSLAYITQSAQQAGATSITRQPDNLTNMFKELKDALMVVKGFRKLSDEIDAEFKAQVKEELRQEARLQKILEQYPINKDEEHLT